MRKRVKDNENNAFLFNDVLCNKSEKENNSVFLFNDALSKLTEEIFYEGFFDKLGRQRVQS